ncbi:hypothetical protein RvY_10026 [Ramazzottius varieornatus]|uniref:Uncharacterized protein n=1 Tax=Ramazzottius varieornatus TaxID=947166 RepID=A0A1D1VGQ8_RAMVA|nr:hypothetical protein RvY_10026 [Ramazzottius varieornatus]
MQHFKTKSKTSGRTFAARHETGRNPSEIGNREMCTERSVRYRVQKHELSIAWDIELSHLKRTYHGHMDEVEELERTAISTQLVGTSERKEISAEAQFQDGSYYESPRSMHVDLLGTDRRTADVASGNDDTTITLKVFSVCLTEDAPVYGQRSGLPAFLQLQLAGQTEVVGNFNLASQPDTAVEINLTTVLPISSIMQAAILSAFRRGSYCDMVISVCLENSSDERGLPIVLAKAGFRFLRVLDVSLEPERVDLTRTYIGLLRNGEPADPTRLIGEVGSHSIWALPADCLEISKRTGMIGLD